MTILLSDYSAYGQIKKMIYLLAYYIYYYYIVLS